MLSEAVFLISCPFTPSEGVAFSRAFSTPSEGVAFPRVFSTPSEGVWDAHPRYRLQKATFAVNLPRTPSEGGKLDQIQQAKDWILPLEPRADSLFSWQDCYKNVKL